MIPLILATLTGAIPAGSPLFAEEEGGLCGTPAPTEASFDRPVRPAPEPTAVTAPTTPTADGSASHRERYGRGFRLDPGEFTFTQRYFWSRLFRPSGRDRMVGAGLLVGALALGAEKRNLQAKVAETDTPQRKLFFRNVQQLGDQGIVPGIAALFYLGGSTFGNYRAKETGYMLAQSALLTAILTTAGQWALNEDRPSAGGDLRPFQGIGHGVSGHASTSASIAGVLSRMYCRIDPDDGPAARSFKRVGKGLAYAVPLMVGLARVNEQRHFAYNSLLGVGIGFWVGNVVVDAHEAYVEGEPVRRWKPDAIGPIFDDDGAPGIGARWKF